MDSTDDGVAIEMDKWAQKVCYHVADIDFEAGGFPFGRLNQFIEGLLVLEHREKVALLEDALTRIFYPLREMYPKLETTIQNIEDHIEGTNLAWKIASSTR